VLEKVKAVYREWYQCYLTLPKTHRYTLGERVDQLFIDILELLAGATFVARDERLQSIKHALKKIDTLKIFFMILWENRSIDEKKYIRLSEQIHEIGRMSGGWKNMLEKENSPKHMGEK
jgi:hypothetical protein